MNVHVRLASAATAFPLLLLGFWLMRALSMQGTFELVYLPRTLTWVLIASALIFLAGEIAFLAPRARSMRLAHWLAPVCFVYILFHLSWMIDLSSAIRSSTSPASILPLTTGATLDLRWMVSATWSFLAVAAIWLLARKGRRESA